MFQSHFNLADMLEVDVVAVGTTVDGYDYAEIQPGDVRITTDNLVGLAAFFLAVGTGIMHRAGDLWGEAVVLAEVDDLLATADQGPFAEPSPPLPFPAPGSAAAQVDAAMRRHPSVTAPDIAGRDL